MPEEDNFESVAVRLRQQLLKHAIARVGPSAAEDIVQETLRRASALWSRKNPASDVKILALQHPSILIKTWRRDEQKRAYDEELRDVVIGAAERNDDIALVHDRTQLAVLFGALEPRDAGILCMCDYMGFSLSEIAKFTGSSYDQ